MENKALRETYNLIQKHCPLFLEDDPQWESKMRRVRYMMRFMENFPCEPKSLVEPIIIGQDTVFSR